MREGGIAFLSDRCVGFKHLADVRRRHLQIIAAEGSSCRLLEDPIIAASVGQCVCAKRGLPYAKGCLTWTRGH